MMQVKRLPSFFPNAGTAHPWRFHLYDRYDRARLWDRISGRSNIKIKEGQVAVDWTRLSCHDFVNNHVRLQLFVLAYNLGNFLRRLVVPPPMNT